MIIDRLENFKRYIALNCNFKEVERFLKNNNLYDLPLGITKVNDNIFVNKQKYIGNKENDSFEVHSEYIDIQIILSGKEKILYSSKDEKIEEVLENDIKFFNEKKNVEMYLKNEFVIFFPGELHKPGIGIDDKEIIKVVIKVRK